MIHVFDDVWLAIFLVEDRCVELADQLILVQLLERLEIELGILEIALGGGVEHGVIR